MTASLQLVAPHAGLEASYRSFVQAFIDQGEVPTPFTASLPCHHFGAWLANLADYERGAGLPAGFVPHSSFWLVRDGVEIVAMSNLRHELSDALREHGGHIGYGVRPGARGRGYATTILRLTLERARARGIETALVMCDRDNVASAAAIRRNRGRLVSEAFVPSVGGVVEHYEIDLSPAVRTG